MSKGVIVQLEYKEAYILKNDGAFISCPRDPSWRIGDVVAIPHRSLFSFKAAIISWAALLLLLIIGSGTIVYHIPASYIEISVNPSAQITLNRFERVLNVAGLNDDGIELLRGVSYKHLSLEEAYARLFNRLENNGYLSNATVQLVVANNSQRNMDRIEQSLRNISEKYMQTNNTRMSIKRYANDEYLALSHPLPVVIIPNVQNQEDSEQPLDETTTQPPDDTQAPSGTSSPQPSNTQAPDNIPSQSPATAPSPTPNNTTPQPTANPHNGNRHNGNWNGGNWQNGWWDWDCR